MGFIKKLFGKSTPVGLVDPLFGSLNQVVQTDIFGKKQLSPDLKGQVKLGTVEVRISLLCGDAGPNDKQRTFFRDLAVHFDAYARTEWNSLLKQELMRWMDVSALDFDFDRDFILHEIRLPTCLSTPIHWKLIGYYSEIDQFITLEFVDFTPTVHFEG